MIYEIERYIQLIEEYNYNSYCEKQLNKNKQKTIINKN